MANDTRQRLLAEAGGEMLREDFRDHILPFDRATAVEFAGIGAHRKAAGRPISQLDRQIAAIARAHGTTVATRNNGDFEACGLEAHRSLASRDRRLISRPFHVDDTLREVVAEGEGPRGAHRDQGRAHRARD